MRIVLVTQDVGNSNALRIIGEALAKEGHEVVSFLGGGKPLPEGDLGVIWAVLAQADKLVVSVSSSEARSKEERHAFIEAKLLGIPVAVFSDIYGMYARPWFRDLLPQADILFVPSEAEVAEARKYVHPQTKIIPAANPYFATYFEPAASQGEVRAKLGIKPLEKMILVAGSKEQGRNELLYRDVIAAANDIASLPLSLVLTLHPGADHGKETYDSVLKNSAYPVQLFGKGGALSSQQLLEGADLVVTGGGSTISIMAACRRKPVVDLIHPEDRAWWRELSGLSFWPPAEVGASELAEDAAGVSKLMRILLGGKLHMASNIRKQQEKLFSPTAFDNATATIVRNLAV